MRRVEPAGVAAMTYPPRLDPELLARCSNSVVVLRSGPDGLRELVRARRVAGLIVRSECRVDAALLDILPHLRFVIRAGSGLDGVDRPELSRRGIELVRNPSAGPDAVAELAMTGLTALTRRIPVATAMLRHGVHGKNQLVGDWIGELTVAVWGAGPVGRAVAAHVRNAGVAGVRLVRPRRERPVGPSVYRMDVHFVCLPLVPGTRHAFGAEFFAKVRSSRPYVCNLGRYELVDMAAARAALEAGAVRGLYVDPVDAAHVPEVAALVRAMDGRNVLFTLHQGAQRRDVRRALDGWAVEQAIGRLQPG